MEMGKSSNSKTKGEEGIFSTIDLIDTIDV
jgi:hypothetical protein